MFFIFLFFLFYFHTEKHMVAMDDFYQFQTARIQETSLQSPAINTQQELLSALNLTFTTEIEKTDKHRRWLAECRKGYHCAENFIFCESLPTQTL